MSTLPASLPTPFGLASWAPRGRRWLQARLSHVSIRAQILVAALAVLVPMLAALASLAYRIEQFRAATWEVTNTHEAINSGNRLLSLASKMQVAARAYALTGDQMF